MADQSASLINIEVKDADKIVTAVSQEAMKWLDKLSKQSQGAVDHYTIAQDVHWPTTPLKQNTILQITLDQIDDNADAFFNHALLGSGDKGTPISIEQRVQSGTNLLAIAIYNTGGFKWGVHIDIRPPNGKSFYFNRHVGKEDAFVPGQGVATHVLLLTFKGQ